MSGLEVDQITLKRERRGCLTVFVVLCLLGLLAAVTFVYIVPMIASKAVVEAKKRVVDAFSPEAITKTFVTWSEFEAEGNEGNILEVATATGTETFKSETDLVLWDRTLPLGKTVSEISVPATYRYHIDLNGDWMLTTDPDAQRVIVVAPKIRPSYPVAFDTGEMQKRSKSGWGRWDAQENLNALEKSITSELNLRAGGKKSINSVREEARKSVGKFVQRWLLSQGRWADGTESFREISIVFEDEIEQESGDILDITTAPPIIRYQTESAE